MAAVKPTIFRWPLDDFDNRFEQTAFREKWESPDFEVEGVPTAKFILRLYPKGVREEYWDDCGAFLYVQDFGDHPFIRVKFEIYFENEQKEQTESVDIEMKFDDTNRSKGWSHAFTQAELDEMVENGPLVTVCEVTPLDPVDLFEWAERTAPSGVCRDIAAGFGSAEFADVEVRVQGKVFKVVKYIICMGSPVFRRMFTHDTKEKETGIVLLEKQDAEMIELLLRYLYSGKVEELADVATRLLPVADCYEVLRLVELCLESLVATVSVETILSDLKLASAHDHKGGFKRKLLEFARENLEELSKLPEWTADFIRENSELVLEVTSVCTS